MYSLQLHDLGNAFAHGISHKIGWVYAGMASTVTATTLSYYQRPWFSVGDYGVTGVDIAWTFAIIISLLSIIKISLAIVEHIIVIKKKLSDMKWDGKCRREDKINYTGKERRK